MIKDFNKIDKVEGELSIPGDKSISHRAVMFSAMANGTSRIYNLTNGEDVKSTQKCFKKLGVEIRHEKDFIEVRGNGYKGFRKPEDLLDAGNSGTTTRLISGILIAQDFESIIVGDESLSKRPMKRIINPLIEMGGKITATENNTLPLSIYPSESLHAIKYELPMASAQVKSAVLLAGLHCNEATAVIERNPSRDHTERMLGLRVEKSAKGIISYSSRENYPEPKEYIIPSDISTAAFFIVLALLSKGSYLKIKNVSLNETRTGILQVLKEMGGGIERENERKTAGEPLGDLIIKGSKLNNIIIHEGIIPNIIDEIPILSIAGIFAEGDFTLSNASELRGKETDRINAICYNLKLLGLEVDEYKDGFSFRGKIKNSSPIFESFGDHRIAMAFGILSLLLQGGGKINNFDCVSISNPDFIKQIESITR